ncbi:hypothetical protein JM946_21345 [Steroidobacter sp. S1-65]|uniref:Uncharacterized protein n=1 Tax=Steroidobacter gossypii TaxID=2805490 RepID=A0ABS1X231_9GAMM|nr:hypothetical protein [Steroidobacter gossypii]MBM0107291.1 hypothetical protein [Steroidobacter gossypii]
MRVAASGSKASLIAAVCGGLLLPLASRAAEDSAPVQATWKTQEIRYNYTGFTTAYDCDAFESKLERILRALGAHEQTRVLAQGCFANRPTRNFFVTITTASPVTLADAPKTEANTSREKLLKRLGVASARLDETFPAEWKTIQLSRDRKLDLEPGDCELMQGLRDHVLPKLSVKIVTDRVSCIPRQLTTQTPELTVSALVALPKPDAPAGKPQS